MRQRFGNDAATIRQAFFREIGAAVAQGWDTVASGKVHESGQRRMGTAPRPGPGNLVLTEEFKREQTGGLLGNIAVVKIGGLFYLAALGVVARVRMATAAVPAPGPGRVVLAQ
jgi:hypothetical protein